MEEVYILLVFVSCPPGMLLLVRCERLERRQQSQVSAFNHKLSWRRGRKLRVKEEVYIPEF